MVYLALVTQSWYTEPRETLCSDPCSATCLDITYLDCEIPPVSHCKMRVCQHCCVYHCHRLPCSPWKSEKSPAVAAKVKFSQADFLAVQVLHVRRKCWVCVVLWLGRKHTWFAHTCSIQLCLYVCVWLLLTNLMSVLFQARCFPAPLQAAQWQPGVPNPPAVRGPRWKASLLPFKVPAKQQHGDPRWWIILH